MSFRQTIATGLRRLAAVVDSRDVSAVARERRVRNIVRQMNSETRRSGKGQN